MSSQSGDDKQADSQEGGKPEWKGYFQDYQAAILESYWKHNGGENVYARIVKDVFSDFDVKPTNKQVNSFISNIRKTVRLQFGELSAEEEFEAMKKTTVKQKKCRIHSKMSSGDSKGGKRARLEGLPPSFPWPAACANSLRDAMRRGDIAMVEYSPVGDKLESVSLKKCLIVGVEKTGMTVAEVEGDGKDSKSAEEQVYITAQQVLESESRANDWKSFIWRVDEATPNIGLPRLQKQQPILEGARGMFPMVHPGMQAATQMQQAYFPVVPMPYRMSGAPGGEMFDQQHLQQQMLGAMGAMVPNQGNFMGQFFPGYDPHKPPKRS